MKSFGSRSALAMSIITGVLYLVKAADGATEFRSCYNISENTHCFDVQYDTSGTGLLIASFENAKKRCNDRNSTLLIIKDEEIDQFVRQYMSDSNNPIYNQNFWIDAYRINDYNNTNTWHWVDSSLPTVPASDITYISDYGWYVVVLEYRENSFYLTAKQPNQNFSYICEYPEKNCSAVSSINMRLFGGRCYEAISNDQGSWYDARNRCLKGGGDLASFPDVTRINFTSWLVSNPQIRYWIGLRFTWYIWIDTVTPITTSTTSTTNSATVTTIGSSTSTGSFHSSNNNILEESRKSRTSNTVAIGVGVGVGVGVPLVIAMIVLVICIIVRRRRHESVSPVKSGNCHQTESSLDQPPSTPAVRVEEDVAGSAYGIVVPSGPTAEAQGDNLAKEQTEYAPLQFL